MAIEIEAIKRINIYEQDLTTAATTEDSLDVVYVPGLYGVNSIATEAGVEPPEGITGIIYQDGWVKGDIFCNVADKKMWVCTKVKEISAETGDGESEPEETKVYQFEWDEVEYVEPLITDPENYSDFTMLPPELFISTNRLKAKYGTHYVNYFDEDENSNIHDHILGDSLTYATELIKAGLPVVYHCGVKFEQASADDIDEDTDPSNDSDENPEERDEAKTITYYRMTATSADLLDAIKDIDIDGGKFGAFRDVLDANELSVKFITTGAHSVVEIEEPASDDDKPKLTEDSVKLVTNLIGLASARGDAVAFIDGLPEQSVVDDTSLFGVLCESGPWTNGEYATAFAPWAYYRTSNNTDVLLPGSFGYLTAYANSIKTNGSALAIAGVTRGVLPKLRSLSLQPTEKLSNAIADLWQNVNDTVANVNGITYIRNYGYCIWGNRTLHDNSEESGSNGLVDTSFLSIRVMLCDLKKRLRNIAVRLLFEQNNDVLWGKFLFGVIPVLDRLKGIAAISNYKVIHIPTNDKTKLKAVIKLVTVKPLEQIEIGIVMVDDDVEVQ